jgi:hypothetical protein
MRFKVIEARLRVTMLVSMLEVRRSKLEENGDSRGKTFLVINQSADQDLSMRRFFGRPAFGGTLSE